MTRKLTFQLFIKLGRQKSKQQQSTFLELQDRVQRDGNVDVSNRTTRNPHFLL